MKNFYICCAAVLLGACQTLPTSAEYLARGDGYFKDGKIKQALTAYNRALKINPGNTAVYASRGSAYFFSGDYQAAAQDFMKVVKANPYQAEGYTALGSAAAAMGDYVSALSLLDTAAKLNPSSAEVLFSRAGVYMMLERYEDAVRDYTAVLSVRPAADVYNARGAVYTRMGKKDLADADFAKAASGSVPEKLNAYRMID